MSRQNRPELEDCQVELLATFAAAWASSRQPAAASRRPPAAGVEHRFLDEWVRWQDEVIRPRLQHLISRTSRELDPAWSRGDELGLLEEHHENDYSNWLRWLLTAPGPVGAVIQHALVSALWPERCPHPAFETERERKVKEGHAGQRGRLDLVLECRASLQALVVEAKVRAPSQGELEKHGGYIRSFEEDHPGWAIRYILLLPDQDAVNGMDTHGFTPVSWRVVSLALRRLLLGGQLSKEPRTEGLVAIAGSAIEGNLLGLPLSAWRQALSGAPLGRATVQSLASSPLVPYLEEAHAP